LQAFFGEGSGLFRENESRHVKTGTAIRNQTVAKLSHSTGGGRSSRDGGQIALSFETPSWKMMAARSIA
jgi:hypothetical protein